MYRIMFALGYAASIVEDYGESDKYNDILRLAGLFLNNIDVRCLQLILEVSDFELIAECIKLSPNPFDFLSRCD